MRDIQAGRALRALRVRRRLSQRALGTLSGVPQSTISLAERGHLDQLRLATGRRLFEALDASLEVDVRWRRGELDRLVDREHASLVEAVVRRLRRVEWLVEVEVSYSIYGERGSIDILAFDPRSLTLLVVEVKSELAAVEATLRKVDEKVRLAPRIAHDRFGWRARAAARMLALPATTTSRRRIADHAATFATTLAMSSGEMRRWLREPRGAAEGVLFVRLIARDDQRRDGRPGAGIVPVVSRRARACRARPSTPSAGKGRR